MRCSGPFLLLMLLPLLLPPISRADESSPLPLPAAPDNEEADSSSPISPAASPLATPAASDSGAGGSSSPIAPASAPPTTPGAPESAAEGASSPTSAPVGSSSSLTADPAYFQGLIIKSVTTEVRGSYRLKNPGQVIVTRVGLPLSLREVSRSIRLLYGLGAIEDIHVHAWEVDGGVGLRYRIWPSIVIRKIHIQGNRDLRDRKVREQLTLRPGSIYAWEDARSQADYLKRFYNNLGYLGVTVTPKTERAGPGRMDVTFRIKEGSPAKISQLNFSGNQSVSNRTLSRVCKLHSGDKYIPKELEEHRKRLTEYYREHKYLAARIQSSIQLSDDRSSVLLQFEVEEGPRVKLDFQQVGYLDVGPLDNTVPRGIAQALRRSKEEPPPHKVRFLRKRAIISLLDIENEQQFTKGFATEAADRILTSLLHKGYSGSEVHPKTVPSPDGREMTFQFVIKPGRRIHIQKISFEGNQFFDSQLLTEVFREALERFAPRDIFSDEALEQALPLLETYYRGNGFLEAQLERAITIQQTPLGPRASIVIRVDEGKRTQVKTIRLEGHTIFSEDELRPLIVLGPGDPYDPQLVKQSVTQIQETYAAKGYVYAQIFVTRQAPKETPTDVAVLFQIDEGMPARIGEIVVRGTQRTRPVVMQRQLTIQTGDDYIQQDVENSRDRLKNTGLFRSVQIYPLAGERVRDILVDVKERPATSISVSGGVQFTALDLSLDSARFDSSFELSRHNLWGLGHRLSVQLELESRYLPTFSDPALSDSLIPDYAIEVGRNIVDYLDNASSRSMTLSYQAPNVFGWNIRSVETTTLFEREQLPGYMLLRNSAAWAVSREDPTSRWRIYLQAQAAVREPYLPETDEKVLLWDIDREERMIAQGSSAVFYDRRDDRFNPTRGVLVSLQTEGGQAFACTEAWETLNPCPRVQLSRAEAYLRLVTSASALVPIWPWLRLDGRLQLGQVISLRTEDGALPVEKRFYLGGAGTIRGFAQNSLGPALFREKWIDSTLVSGWTAVPTGGNSSIWSTAELQVPLEVFSDWFTDIEFALFGDAGNVYWTGASRQQYETALQASEGEAAYIAAENEGCTSLSSNSGVRTSAGLGVRYRTGIGPIRLDFGFPIQRQCLPTERPWALHFSIGLF